MIIEIKNKLIEAIKLALIESDIKCKLLSSNFNEDDANVPQSSCQIQVLYDDSEWENVSKSNYYRTLNYTIRLAVKDLKIEDNAQIFNDYIISKLLSFNFGAYQLKINSDEFEKFDQGFWFYIQRWSVGVPNAINGDNCSYGNFDITQLAVNLSPDSSLPLEFDDSREVIIIEDGLTISNS